MKQAQLSIPKHVQLVFDFDSTLVQLEALDELARIVLSDAPDRERRVQAIAAITAEGMAGRLSFAESLRLRFEQIAPQKHHVEKLIPYITENVSPSFRALRDVLAVHARRIWIVSGGFKELIVPTVRQFGISDDHVLANDFVWSGDGESVVGYDTENPLSQDGGKVAVVRQLRLDPETVVMIGDGMTDYALRAAGVAGFFIAYTETVERPEVVALADAFAGSLGEALRIVNRRSSLIQ